MANVNLRQKNLFIADIELATLYVGKALFRDNAHCNYDKYVHHALENIQHA